MYKNYLFTKTSLYDDYSKTNRESTFLSSCMYEEMLAKIKICKLKQISEEDCIQTCLEIAGTFNLHRYQDGTAMVIVNAEVEKVRIEAITSLLHLLPGVLKVQRAEGK